MDLSFFGNLIKQAQAGWNNMVQPNPNAKPDYTAIFTTPTPTPSVNVASTPTPTASPTFTPSVREPAIANALPRGFQFDPSTVGITIPSEYTFQPPTGKIAQGLFNAFPKEATQAAVAAWAENASNPYDANARGWNNPAYSRTTPGFGNTYDNGPMQINEKTFADFLRRHPDEMNSIGATNPNATFDPIIAPLIAKLIQGEQGWGAWKGWQNKGVTGLQNLTYSK